MNARARWFGWARSGTLAAVTMLLAASGVGTAVQGDVTAVIINNSKAVMGRVFIFPSGTPNDNRDRLGNDLVQPGQQKRITLARTPDCLFTVIVKYQSSEEEVWQRQDLCRTPELTFTGTPPPSAAGVPLPNPSFNLVNRAAQPIAQMYVWAQGGAARGPARLAAAVAPGGHFAVRLPAGSCDYNVRIEYTDRSFEERRLSTLCDVNDVVFDGTTAVRPPPPPPPPAPPPPVVLSWGTGFYVSANGYALTNDHVIDECGSVAVVTDAGALLAKIVRRDVQSDLALLLVGTPAAVPFARFRAEPGIRHGESVIAAGFPLPDTLQNGLNITVGNVSSLTGVGGNASRLQITAPVQGGNSGGPLLDSDGHIVGVVVSRLRDPSAQNVNYAVQGALARVFVQGAGVKIEERPSKQGIPVGDVADRARTFTFQIACRK